MSKINDFEENIINNFFLKSDSNLSKLELRQIISIIASCTDLEEVYYETDDEHDKLLLIKAIKARFLPSNIGDSNE